MSETDAQNIYADKLADMIDRLSVAQQDQLRNRLNDRFWSRRLDQIVNGDFTRATAQAWQGFIERLESGNIDEDIKKLPANACEHVIKAFISLAQQVSGNTHSAGNVSSDDPDMQLEEAYQELQSNLIQVRQAVAQSIATEKQLEQQLSKNRDQSATWQERASMAVEQGNEGLATLARQRQSQYLDAADHLEKQLGSQRNGTIVLRQRLTELEASVQKSYTQKQVLIARYKAAQATAKANAIMAKMGSSGAVSVLERMEQKVAEREAAAAAAAEMSDKVSAAFTETLPDYNQLLIMAAAALERATTVIERMEKMVAASENQIR